MNIERFGETITLPLATSDERLSPYSLRLIRELQNMILQQNDKINWILDQIDPLFKMIYATIYAHDQAVNTTFSGTGEGNSVQVTIFDTNGDFNNAVPDHTNDHITINETGKYYIFVTMSVETVGASARTVGWHVEKNNGATSIDNLHVERRLTGGGGDVGSVALSGIVDLTEGDTIELWCWNDDNTNSILISDVSMSVLQVG